jgi:hypothetical protein
MGGAFGNWGRRKTRTKFWSKARIENSISDVAIDKRIILK